ncbi:hypothetical protein BKA65DRAFT_472146 [Rhexocercosporidium sp. MPI-PUGE-AT-0058]|nr:hypothetical protein BKA65DRAFT_472146 [Rhexocercosporidium sp. MPI-PUGE-AT-0058]
MRGPRNAESKLAPSLDGPRANDLWAQAVEKLSPEDRTIINFSFNKLSILSDLKAETEAAQLKCEERRLGFKRSSGEKVILRDVLGKFAKWIALFREVGDVAVSYDPGHAALPWALVRFVLQVAIGDLEKYDFVVENLETVSRCICRCRITEQLYLDGLSSAAKEELKTALQEFQDLLDSITSNILEVDQYTRISAHEDDSMRHSELKRILLECEAPLKRISRQLQDIQDNLTDTKRRKILDWMSDTTKLPYLKHHKENKRQILKGTGKWLLNDDIASSLLWLHGIPGSGKSKLTSLVIEDALQLSARGLVPRPAIFYCSQNTAEPLRADPTSILASIARQLASLTPSSAVLPPVIDLYEEMEGQGSASGTLDIDESKELILALVNLYPVTTIIIDALDECCANERSVILNFIRMIVEESSSLVRIFISSREDGDIVFHLDRFPNMRISSGKNQVDIDAFVASETSLLVKPGYLLRNSARQQELAEEVATKVAAQASGMFRWASLQLENLAEMKTDADIRDRLGKNPPSLEELYLEIYNRIASSQQLASSRIAQNAFSLLLGMKKELKPDLFTRANTHVDISLCALSQIGDWNRAGLEIWSWNFRELGRYINKYLRFHLEKAGGQNRLIALRRGLWSLLNMVDLSTLDGSEGNLSIRWRAPKPPVDADIAHRCLFNACALNFVEIVEYLLDGCSDQGMARDQDHMPSKSRFSTYDSELKSLPQVRAPDLSFELAKHAVRCGAPSVLSYLLDKPGLDTSGPNLALEAARCTFVEDTGCFEILMDRCDLSCVSTDMVLQAVAVGFGTITPFTSRQSKILQVLIEQGLHFHVDNDFMKSVNSVFVQTRNCKSWRSVDLLLRSGVIAPPGSNLFLDILADKNGEYMLRDLLDREDGRDTGRDVFTQDFLEALVASSAEWITIVILLSSGLDITKDVLFSACTEVQPNGEEDEKFWRLVGKIYEEKESKVLEFAQELLSKAAKNGKWEGVRVLLSNDKSLVITEDLVLLAANREQSLWGYAAAEKRLKTLLALKRRTDCKAYLQILDDAIAKPCETPGYKIVTEEGYTFVVKEQIWTT